MDLGLNNKLAIVCAASKGLGKATAFALAAEGANLVIFARHKQDLESTASEIIDNTGSKVLPILADITKPEDIKRVVEIAVQKFGTIHILVNNAGGPPVGNFSDLTDEMWSQGFNLTLLSLIRMTRLVIPYMQKNRWGRIINITSITAKQPVDDLIISSTLRPGILGLSKILSRQYSKYGILINNVCPGYVLTKRTEKIAKKRAENMNINAEEYIKQQSKTIPMERYGKPEEVANLIVFLASERASYITGATFSVDGGIIQGIL